ncbi:MAG: chromosomal replication initiator protein DnaA [Treponema sp.]|jgi:chromosomal replication initiator protein|nr:chromosomal replication initiator protein DnaA [Treponema sp.]
MAEQDYEVFWQEALSLIRGEKDEPEFAMWFDIEYLRAVDDVITVTVPSAFYRDQVKQRYQNYIETKIRDLTGKNVSLLFEIKPRERARNINKDEKVNEKTIKTSSITNQIAIIKEKAPHSQLNRDYTFDKYVIGDNNSFAANAAKAIALNPGNTYNPLLIYGGVGLGKTHLMQSIGNLIHDKSESKIIYITAENFTNEFIREVKEDRMSAFKNKYRHTDVLLIDDIHFLQGKTQTQEELFYTFDALYDAKKQIVFTCDRPVSELKQITDRLRTRFERGLNVDLQPPKYETRCAILKKKMEERHITIPDEVINLVSKNISTNIRDLEAALTKLIAYAELLGKPITLDIAQQQLKDVFSSPKQFNISTETIMRVIAEYFNLSYSDLKGPKRGQSIVLARQLAMYIAREITEDTLTEIGQTFNRDYSTVIHAISRIDERIRTDSTMEPTIETLKRTIREAGSKL